jgi:CheY-like chemotaxis protein
VEPMLRAQTPSVILTDHSLPGRTVLGPLRQLGKADHQTSVVLITGSAAEALAVAALPAPAEARRATPRW